MEGPFAKTEDGNFIWFFWEAVANPAASAKEGVPIYDKGLMCRIVAPGQSKSDVVYMLERWHGEKLLTKHHAHDKYAKLIDDFKRKEKGDGLDGTPIENLPGLDIRIAAQMRAMHIYTVEALRDCPDTVLQNIGMGAREYQQRAVAYLEAAAGGAPMTRLIAENEDLKTRMAIMEKQIADLTAPKGEGGSDKAALQAAAQAPKKGKAA